MPMTRVKIDSNGIPLDQESSRESKRLSRFAGAQWEPETKTWRKKTKKKKIRKESRSVFKCDYLTLDEFVFAHR